MFPPRAQIKCHLLIIHSQRSISPHKARLPSFLSLPFPPLKMVPELEKPRVTEIQVRMDCNGCVQKIKKALHGINGIYDIYIDLPQQKLTVIGWADPERIVKAIRQTKRIAIICSHTEQPDPGAQPAEPPQAAPEGEAAQPPPPPLEAPQAETSILGESPRDQPPLPSNETYQVGKPSPSPVAVEAGTSQPTQPRDPKAVGEVHVIHHQPPSYGYRCGPRQSCEGQWNRYQKTTEPQQPVYVNHSYNTHGPSPDVIGYEYASSPYEYARSQPQHGRTDHYKDDNNRNEIITSIFSDDNPNACTIA